jgi:hypothetical protein
MSVRFVSRYGWVGTVWLGMARYGSVRYGTVGTVLSRSKPLTLMIMYLFSSTDVSHTAPTSPGLPEIIAGDHTAPAVPVPDVPVVLARRSTRAAAAPTSPGLPEIEARDHTAPAVPDVPVVLARRSTIAAAAPTSPGLPEIEAGDHTAPAVPDVPVVLARRSTRAAAARPRYSMFFSGKNFAHFTPPPSVLVGSVGKL